MLSLSPSVTGTVTDQGPRARRVSTSKLSSNIKYLCRSKVLKELGLRIKSRLVSVHIKFQVLIIRL